MISIDIPNRPFSTETITGLMLPDGIFEAALGKQRINAQFKNTGGSAINNFTLYVESVSNPAIIITPATYSVPAIGGNAVTVRSWDIDVSNAPVGSHYVSFIANHASGKKRIIKKIFVTRVEFDQATQTFSAATPEGILSVKFKSVVIPANVNCCCSHKKEGREPSQGKTFEMKNLADLLNTVGRDFKFCPPGYLPLEIETAVTPTPPFPGQYGDLPFNDPWWKIILCIIALILLIAAAINDAVNGTGDVGVSTGTGGSSGSGSENCCGFEAQGGSSSYVTAGLVAAAAAVATVAACSDVRDPYRRGQDNTVPGAGENTILEKLDAKFKYPEPIAMGRPFKAGVDWKYTRITVDPANAQHSYSFSASDMNENVHVLSNYIIKAPDVIRVYQKQPFIITGEFFDAKQKQMSGAQLFVKCFLFGPGGRVISFAMQDDGLTPDQKANDGLYTGIHYFSRDDGGLWKIYVIAQDINNAQTDMNPEDAARIIGGMVLTHQLTITFEGGNCPFVADGDVNVIV
jgi:hypothetical protein